MPLRRLIRELDANTETLASINVDALWSTLRDGFLNEFARLDRNSLSGEELSKAMRAWIEGLSEKSIEELARTGSTVAYSQGRAAELLSQREAGAVQYVVRSAILDNATCDACANLDGEVIEVGSDEFNEYMPPAKCEGGDRCRCLYIPVAG